LVFLKAFVAHCTCLWALGALWLTLSILSASAIAQTYTDLHDFDCNVEGCLPTYPEILAQGRDGNLYGTTDSGGTSNMGTVFKMAPLSGVVTTIYNFSSADGQYPDGGLILGTDGNFYGTTLIGGANNLGTVFKITPAGVLTTLHSFDGTDGSWPRPGLVQGKNGAFYGTTCGFNPPWTAYSITSSGKFKTINASNDVRVATCSYGPLALGDDGNLYGTAPAGGATEQGMVFRLTPAGNLKLIYAADSAHGNNPFAPVTQGNDGLFYGTTIAGGSGTFGVVFKLSKTGKFTKLHEFGLDLINDGIDPYTGLVAASDGKFYGATSAGRSDGNVPHGNLFSVTSSGTYNLLYAFDGAHGYLDQATPMQHTNGRIYGIAEGGGLHNGGVIYSLDNGAPPFVYLLTRWGNAGQAVGIFGQGLTGTSSVKFGTGSASFNVVSDTYMTANVPSDGVTGYVTVTTPSGTLTSSRKFDVVPVITSFTPTSGPVGTQLTITGSGLTGATKVTFGGVKATNYTVNSGTTITAMVPGGALTGKIKVTTAGGTASSQATFTVTP
jgi:uncharacterized repeat protein (TIGR03803 family)